jgi:hypothetical protein
MPKFSCNNCGNTFAQDANVQHICPACGSSSTVLMQEQSRNTFWKDLRIIIPVGIVLLMMIILFLLRTPTREYTVDVDPFPDSCMFKVIVKDGDKILNPDKFIYSVDNVHWNKDNVFREKSFNQFKIQVRFPNDSTKKFIYNFVQPFTFKPTCSEPVENPCDCKNLQIKSVSPKFIQGQYRLVVDALPANCPKLYSYTGLGGDYIKDSIIALGKDAIFNIYVKTANCEPIAYFDNPVKFKMPVSTGKIKGADLEKQFQKLIEYQDVTTLTRIESFFQDGDVIVQIMETGEHVKNQPLSRFLNDLKLIGSMNDWKIKVKNITFNDINKIKGITVER